MLDLDHPRSVPYALIRLGDWVPQVAETAVRILRARMARGDGASLIEHRRLVERLGRIERTDLRWFHDEVFAFLRSPGGRHAVEAALDSADAGERLFALKVLFAESEYRPELVARAASDPSPRIRRWLAAHIARGDVQVPRSILLALLSDRSTTVSRLIVRSLDDASCADLRDELVALSFSGVRPVRRSARYAVQRSGSFDFAAACRRTIETSAPAAISSGVVGCLAETGDAGDIGIFRKLLEHNAGFVRAEAVSGILRFGGTDAAAEVVGLLDDPSGRVRRAVIMGLTAAASHLWVEPARGILASGTNKGRVAALKALAERGGWDPLPDLLTAIVSEDPDVRLLGWDMLGAWQRHFGVRGWIRPTTECRGALGPRWQAARNLEEPPAWWDGFRDMVDEALEAGGDSR
ncbi:hypothetical protein [Nodularia spumigena]|uniref:hypothetical protein n=1 Tax=Nodularia spumigena TaxID=70799 RepID=UPI002B1EF0DD|nr:hypothetical protein [Nodularia spumigena]